jgi:hypothetical protein
MDLVRDPGESAFQRVLAERRDRYNALYAQARRNARNLDAPGFLGQLRDLVGPAVDAAAATGADPLPVADALVELSLVLSTRGTLRNTDGLRLVLPELASFVGRDPRRVPVAVVNALHHLESAPDGRPGAWLDTMITASRVVPDVPALLDVGAVAAWRCGLAQLRAAALRTAERLTPQLRGIALGVSTVDDSVLAHLTADPWFDPAAPAATPELRLVRRVGQFRGFGGVFTRPPTVLRAADGWYATDGGTAWRIHADRYGTGFRRVPTLPAALPLPPQWTLRAGGLQSGGMALDLPELNEMSSWAAHEGTAAVTTPFTHAILLIARTT